MAALPQPAVPPSPAVRAQLERDLRGELRGEVGFDAGSRALYATDGSIYRQVPWGVVWPRDIPDLIRAVAVCRHHGAPLLARGGGTSLAGQTCNQAVVLDVSRHLNRVLRVDGHHRCAWVEPGVVLDDLRAAAERHGLTFAPDPATHNRCNLGGMLGNNSCGVHSILGGRTAENVEELDVLTYDGLRLRVGATPEKDLRAIIAAGGRRGEIYASLQRLRDQYGDRVRARYPKIPRRVSGYNLDELLPENGFHVARALVGSESTCAIILAAKLRLLPSPRSRPLLVLGYPSVDAAGDHVPALLQARGLIGLEGFDDVLLTYIRDRGTDEENIRLLPPGAGWLLVEFGADHMSEAEHHARHVMADLARQPHPPAMRLLTDSAEIRQVWKLREVAVGVTSFTPDHKVAWPGWEDSAVPPDKLGPYIRDLRGLLNEFGYHASIFGHFGQACLHLRIDFNLRTVDGIRHFRRFVERAADRVVFYGGSVSGEHGDGQARAELLPKMFGSDLVRGLEAFKAVWDPEWRLNPGKMVAAYKLDENLRLGPAYRPAQPTTYFQFPDDHGFAQAVLRCSGLGECRREDLDHASETMCPSYLVTREEQHSTRGRAHLLWEMLHGEVIRGGWRDRQVRRALDLCLSCKGCRRDCPVNVDMASYKAEFLAHYYQGRLRPRAAYAMGGVREWLELANRLPRLANALTQTPGLALAAKLAAGVAWRRPIPPLAAPTFRQWFHGRMPSMAGTSLSTAPASPEDGAPHRRILLWADTFTDFFQPTVGQAAVTVLEAAGCALALPPPGLCCGRPLYDYGLLPRAQRRLRQVLTALGPEIDAGTPLVVLEPSCAAVFRDEAVNLFPHDERARRLRRQTFTLAEFLQTQLPGYQPPPLRRRALVHGHCHHKAILQWDAEVKLLRAMGLDFELLRSGCCGMAGSFGYEARHYAVSRAAGERVLLPAVRAAGQDTLILADGFSCREQIEQCTRRRGLHLAQILDMALRDGAGGTAARPPERAYRDPVPSGLPLALPAAAALAATAYFAWRRRAA